MKSCIIPGSFDPFTLGHLDVVRRASKLYDKVYVAILVNPAKRGKFDFAQRKRIAELSCAGLMNVEVLTADGLLVDLCRALSVNMIVKGVRNEIDFSYESEMAGMNRRLAPEIETVFMPCSPEFACVSSTFARELMKYEKDLRGIIHPDAIEYICSIS